MSPTKEKSPKKRAPKAALEVPTPSTLRRGRSASVDIKPIPVKLVSHAKSEVHVSEPVKKRAGRRVASESVDDIEPAHEKEEPPKKKARGRHAIEESEKPDEILTEKVETKKGRGK